MLVSLGQFISLQKSYNFLKEAFFNSFSAEIGGLCRESVLVLKLIIEGN